MRPRSIKSVIFAILITTSAAALAADPESAGLEALRQAALQGSADAQYELGILYEFGYRFADHKAAAYAWYSRAAEQGNALAGKRRDALKPHLGPADIGRGEALIASQTAPTVPTPLSSAPAPAAGR